MRVVDIWPCRPADAAVGASAKVSRSLRIAFDCLRAELKRAFCLGLENWFELLACGTHTILSVAVEPKVFL